MFCLKKNHIDAIRFSKELSSSVKDGLGAAHALASKPAGELSDHDYDILHNACTDALTNDAPTVEEFVGNGDYGPFSIFVRGIPGAYFVSAPEFDNEGAFNSLDEALSQVDWHYGDYIARTNDD